MLLGRFRVATLRLRHNTRPIFSFSRRLTAGLPSRGHEALFFRGLNVAPRPSARHGFARAFAVWSRIESESAQMKLDDHLVGQILEKQSASIRGNPRQGLAVDFDSKGVSSDSTYSAALRERSPFSI